MRTSKHQFGLDKSRCIEYLYFMKNNQIKLYRNDKSGHSHRVELFLSIINVQYSVFDIDLARGEHKTEEFLALNSFGQVPVIDDGGVVLADSNSILVYLALRYGESFWLPRDPVGFASVQRWLSVAAGQLVAGPALARFIRAFQRGVDGSVAIERAHALFRVLEHELSTRKFLVGSSPTIADIAMYTYSAHAPEGGVSLEGYVSLRSWLARIEALPGFLPMKRM